MDDLFDELMPLSMTGLPSSQKNGDISFSQAMPMPIKSTRLSRSFRRRMKNGFDSCAGSTIGSTMDMESSQMSRTGKLNLPSSSELRFCPSCQAPFHILNVNPQVHAFQCNVSMEELEECPSGELCCEVNIFHYRDFAHRTLAKLRSSKDHVPPPVQFITPEKKKTAGGETVQLMSPTTSSGQSTKNRFPGNIGTTSASPRKNMNRTSVKRNIFNSPTSNKCNNASSVSVLSSDKKKMSASDKSSCLNGNTLCNKSTVDNVIRRGRDRITSCSNGVVDQSSDNKSNNSATCKSGVNNHDIFPVAKPLRNNLDSHGHDTSVRENHPKKDTKIKDSNLRQRDRVIAEEILEKLNYIAESSDFEKPEKKRRGKIQSVKPNDGLGEREEFYSNKKINKNVNVSDLNIEDDNVAEENRGNVLTTHNCNCKVDINNSKDKTGVDCDCKCSNKLKLDAIVEYTSSKGDKRNSENRNVKTCVLPCNKTEEVKSDDECSDEVRAIMSVVLSPSKENSADGVDKVKTPVKIDASCNELGWETVGIAALPDTDIEDVKVSLCKCTKTMQVNCSVLQKQVETDFQKKEEPSVKDLQPKFFSTVKELGLPHQQKEISELPNHQMSITSYFRVKCHPSSLRPTSKDKIEDVAEDVESKTTSSIMPEKENCCLSNDFPKAARDIPVPITPSQNKEAAVVQWKQILKGMTQKGQSAMSVMTDDSLSVMSDGHTSGSNSESSQWNAKKICPYYKKIPETSFVVDAFQYGIIPGVSHYFLSHFHSDHYGGLRKSFSKPIYCSSITAALVKMKLRVDERYIHTLEVDVPKKINGVLVTALDANHCPGSIMFLFQLQDGRNFLHVGDFRADPRMESYPCFWNVTIDKLFLDTTYCEPRYSFPMQSETIARVVELSVEHHSRHPATLFVCGSYTIGKEKVFLGIVEALNCKLWAQSDKRKVLECINNPLINERLTTKQWEAQVHVCRMSDLNLNCLQRYLVQHKGAFTHIVAFIPTGWEMRGQSSETVDINTTSYGNITIYGVPYSEHSSFTELRRFVRFLKPLEVIPTVNVGRSTKRVTMQNYFKQWLSESSLESVKRKNENDHHVQQKMARYLKPSKIT